MLTAEVALADIDFNNREYELISSVPGSNLEQSISSVGLLNPVKLIKNFKNYSVLTGWKRLHVINKLNYPSVPSQIYKENELTPLQVFTYIYIDNKDRFTELEKAELINRLLSSGDMSKEEIINEFLPLIGLNPSLNNLNKYRSIALLEKELKEACFNELVTFEQLHLLSETDDPQFRTGFYSHFLRNNRFNNNETRDLLKDVQAICIRSAQSIDDLAKQILKEKQDKNTIRKLVKSLSYPKLTDTEQKYNEIVKELNLGSSSRLINHPYFESNDLELRIKFKNQEDLISELESLKKSIDEGKIEKLLKLIKEGI